MIKRIARGSWWYALGLILLFTLAAIATSTVIYSVERMIDSQDFEMAKRVSMVGNWLLTMGFMFLAAGLGMWAIQYASFRESIKRLGSFIDAMDYLHDGLVALDRKGRVMNANPAARSLAPELENSGCEFRTAFPCLSEQDTGLLIDSSGPHEIEREIIGKEALRILRFRSQPTPDLPLVLISDVTERKSIEAHQREATRLQLIGRIAHGVADDFNRILSVISGQTGLLVRLSEGREGAEMASHEIYRAIQSGASLATHLLDLSRTDISDTPADYIEQHAARAIELLRLAMPAGWEVVGDIGKRLPPTNLAGSQIEQSIVNLGLICCDAMQMPGTVKVSLRTPGPDHLDAVGERYALIVLISASDKYENTLLDMPPADAEFQAIRDDAGAVLSIVRAGIEEAGGKLDCFRSENGMQLFRIAVPLARYIGVGPATQGVPESLRPHLSGRSLLLAVAAKRGDEIEKQARILEMRVFRATDTISLLASIERGSFDAVMLDRRMIEPEAQAMIRAIGKLRPELALFVIGGAVGSQPGGDHSATRCFPATAPLKALFEAMAEIGLGVSPPAGTPSGQAQVVNQA